MGAEHTKFILSLGIIIVPVLVFWLILKYRHHRTRIRQLAINRFTTDHGWHYEPYGDLSEREYITSLLSNYRNYNISGFSDLISGEYKGQPFRIVSGWLNRLTFGYVQHLSVMVLEVPGLMPHFFITPEQHPLIRRIDLAKEFVLHPAELQTSGLEAYIPTGYQIEALQILEPDTLEWIKRLGLSIELHGSYVYVYYRTKLTPSNIEQELASVLPLVKSIQGLQSLQPVGEQTTELQTSAMINKLANRSVIDVASILIVSLAAIFLGAVLTLMALGKW